MCLSCCHWRTVGWRWGWSHNYLTSWGNSIQFRSVAQSYQTHCNPMDCSTPGFPCPSPTPGACSKSFLVSQWCHPTTLSSVVPSTGPPQQEEPSPEGPSECSGEAQGQQGWRRNLVSGDLRILVEVWSYLCSLSPKRLRGVAERVNWVFPDQT